MVIRPVNHLQAAQFQVFFAISQPSVDSPGVIKGPILFHRLEGARQPPPFPLFPADGVGRIVKFIIEAGIAAFDERQNLLKEFLTNLVGDIPGGQFFLDLPQQVAYVIHNIIITSAAVIHILQVRVKFLPERQNSFPIGGLLLRSGKGDMRLQVLEAFAPNFRMSDGECGNEIPEDLRSGRRKQVVQRITGLFFIGHLDPQFT